MKNKLLIFFAIALSLTASAQYDTLITISSYNGYARKASPGWFQWRADGPNPYMSLQITVLTYSGGNLVNDLVIHPYTKEISTENVCVVPTTGAEKSCDSTGVIPQYKFLRSLSLLPISIMAQKIQYIMIADSNHAFDN